MNVRAFSSENRVFPDLWRREEEIHNDFNNKVG
jgi:hypothetical protein